jgi:hypothetical protein
MRSRFTNQLPIAHYFDILPNTFLVSEGGPPNFFALCQELVNCSIFGRDEKRLAGDAIVESKLALFPQLALELWAICEVFFRLSKYLIIAADLIRQTIVNPEPQVRLHRHRASAMRLVRHHVVVVEDSLVFYFYWLRVLWHRLTRHGRLGET